MYYACLKHRNGIVEKVPFENRDDARKYIADNYKPIEHEQVWTE